MGAGEPPDVGGPGPHDLHADAALALPRLLHHLPPGQSVLPHQGLHTLDDVRDAEAAQLAVPACPQLLDVEVGLL